MTNSTVSPSQLLEYLPEIYQSDPFLGRFLLAFEKILLGGSAEKQVVIFAIFLFIRSRLYRLSLLLLKCYQANFSTPGLEEKIAHIYTYFDPQETPPEFLTWLASWVALSLRADLDIQQQRDFIANIVERYRYRGTKANLEALLKIFIKQTPTITETSNAELQIGDAEMLNDPQILNDPQRLPPQSVLGTGTYLGGGVPHFFTVSISLSTELNKEPLRQIAIATAIIEQEKPAHTYYLLKPIYRDTMQIGTFDPISGKGTGSQIGINTILGNIPQNSESN
ncbi:MAG: phage tail protein [Xenococcus sp. (in: cyanobacteria)]